MIDNICTAVIGKMPVESVTKKCNHSCSKHRSKQGKKIKAIAECTRVIYDMAAALGNVKITLIPLYLINLKLTKSQFGF